MPTQQQWREARDFSRVLDAAQRKPLLWVHRPIYLHDRAPDDTMCTCGCNSRFARHVETRQHIDVLIDRIDGTRRVFSQVDDKAKFAVLAWCAEKVTMPLRCYKKQLDFILAKPKAKAAFGGVRGGKSTITAEETVDEVLENGGYGSQIWWVAPTLQKTRTGVQKLVEGQVVGKGRYRRFVRPLFPPELVRSYPKKDTDKDQTIYLIDGTCIYLKYASRKGGNMKGDPPIYAAVDEGCEIAHRENLQQLYDRLMEGDGRMCFATTPVAGHWLKDEIYDKGAELAEWDGKKHKPVWVRLTCFDNPWISEEYVKETILSKAGGIDDLETALKDQNVRREVLGEWVGDGPILWQQWDPPTHLYSGASRDAEDYGLENISNTAGKRFWRNRDKIVNVAGQDFNVWPMCLVIAQIACHPALDSSDPQSWTLLVTDEIIKRGNIFEFGSFVVERASKFRKLPDDYFRGLPIACDPSGAQPNSHIAGVHGMSDRNSTLAKEMNRLGFDCRPCRYGTGGNPQQPAILDRISLGHKLMRDRIALPNGIKWQGRTHVPRLLIHAERCPKLVKSIESQESDDKGKPLKESGTASDRLSGPTDALTYLAWAIFGRSEYSRKSQINWQ